MIIRIWFKDGTYREFSYKPGSYQISYSEFDHDGIEQIIIDADVYHQI